MKKGLLIIGMSPGNGYFKQEVIDKLLSYCLENFENLSVFIPDVPATSTYEALGYPKNKSQSKAILQGNNFRNRIEKTISDKKLDQSRIKVFNWIKENIETNLDYRNAFNYIKNLYENNFDFQKDINLETEKVLVNNQFAKKEITESDIVIGTHYILSEFAFLLFVSNTENRYEKFIYGYHRPWAVWEKFINGGYDGEVKNRLVFLLLPNFSIEN